MTFKPKRVLFVLAGLLGDSIMCLPVIAEARRLWPEAHITLLGRNHNVELLSAIPSIDEFHACNADPFSIRKSREIDELQSWLNAQEFEIAVMLLGDPYAHLLKRAGIPIRVAEKGTRLSPSATHVYNWGTPRTWGTNERMNSLRCLGFDVANTVPRLSVDEAAKETARLKLYENGLKHDSDFAILHPFGSTPLQWWPIENAAPLAKFLSDNFALKLLIVGKEYSLNGVAVSPSMRGLTDPNIIDGIGLLELPELCAAIDGSKLVITTDSGPFHIAGALGKTIVGLFRAARPEHADAYPNTQVIFGRNNECRTQCDWSHCSSPRCRQMDDISLEKVLLSIRSVLGEPKNAMAPGVS